MANYLDFTYDIDEPELVSNYDELSLWAAPFGLKLLDRIKMRTNLKILDVGPGPGFPLIEIAQRFGTKSRVYGIDPWKGGIERIKKKIEFLGLENVTIYRGIAEDLPFEKSFFDLVVSNNGMNNVQDIVKAFSEVYRVSKGGSQFVFTMNTEKTMIEFYTIFKKTLDELGLSDHKQNIDKHIQIHRPSDKVIKKLIEKTGFITENICADDFKIRFATGTALLNHSFIKHFFLPPWKNCVPEEKLKEVFLKLEYNLNDYSKEKEGIDLSIPFICYDCFKP